MIGTPLNSSEDGNIFKQVKTSSVMFLEGLNDCFHQVPFFFLLILGNHHNVLCTATLAVSVRVLFFKFTALRILMTRNTHSKWNMMLLFLKKWFFISQNYIPAKMRASFLNASSKVQKVHHPNALPSLLYALSNYCLTNWTMHNLLKLNGLFFLIWKSPRKY